MVRWWRITWCLPARPSAADVQGTTPVDEAMVKPQMHKPFGHKRAHKAHMKAEAK
jgi:hypothetical protein